MSFAKTFILVAPFVILCIAIVYWAIDLSVKVTALYEHFGLDKTPEPEEREMSSCPEEK